MIKRQKMTTEPSGKSVRKEVIILILDITDAIMARGKRTIQRRPLVEADCPAVQAPNAWQAPCRVPALVPAPDADTAIISEIARFFGSTKTPAGIVPVKLERNTCYMSSVLNLLRLFAPFWETIGDLLANIQAFAPKRSSESALFRKQVAMFTALDCILDESSPKRLEQFYLSFYELVKQTKMIHEFPPGKQADPADLMMFFANQLTSLFGGFLPAQYATDPVSIALAGGWKATYLSTGYMSALVFPGRSRRAVPDQDLDWVNTCELASKMPDTILNVGSLPYVGVCLPESFPKDLMVLAICTLVGNKNAGADRHYVLIVYLPDGRIYRIDGGRCELFPEVGTKPYCYMASQVVSTRYDCAFVSHTLGIPTVLAKQPTASRPIIAPSQPAPRTQPSRSAPPKQRPSGRRTRVALHLFD